MIVLRCKAENSNAALFRIVKTLFSRPLKFPLKSYDYCLKYNLLYSGHQGKLKNFHEISVLHYEHDIQFIDV